MQLRQSCGLLGRKQKRNLSGDGDIICPHLTTTISENGYLLLRPEGMFVAMNNVKHSLSH